MKILTILSLLLLTSAASGELTKEDLHDLKEDLHKVIKEENAASEKRMKEYIDLKIETVNARIDGVEKSIDELDKKLSDRIRDVWHVVLGLIGLIVATIAIPQIIMAYRDRGRKEMESSQQAMQTQIDQLRAQIEAMQNTPS